MTKGLIGTFVDHKDELEYGICESIFPERVIELCMTERRSHGLHMGLVFSLCYCVLLGIVGDGDVTLESK